MNEKHEEIIRFHEKQILWTNVCLLFFHIVLLFIFWLMHVTVMAYMNMASVILYTVMLTIRNKSPRAYIYTLYAEVYLHMVLAVVMTGWGTEFQVYCFVLIAALFYCDYIIINSGKRTTHPGILSLIIAVTYMCLRFLTAEYNPYYILDVKQKAVFIVMNCLVTFSFIAFCQSNFKWLSLREEENLSKLALKDELTGLDNRRSMIRFLEECESESDYLIAIADIYDFKNVNDSFGHSAGDHLLRQIGTKLKILEDERTKVCRWGGEEFLIVITGASSYQLLCEKMKEVKEDIATGTFAFKGKRISVTVTVGVARHKIQDETDHTISRADKYLYYGKNHGKNQVVSRNE